jgi:hypothetical protein
LKGAKNAPGFLQRVHVNQLSGDSFGYRFQRDCWDTFLVERDNGERGWTAVHVEPMWPPKCYRMTVGVGDSEKEAIEDLRAQIPDQGFLAALLTTGYDCGWLWLDGSESELAPRFGRVE